MTKVFPCCWLVMMILATTLQAQDTIVTSRQEQIEQERLAKAATLSPEELTGNEDAISKTQDVVEAILSGSPARLKIGGLPGGSGLALGPQVQWMNDSDTSLLRLSAVGSLRRAYGGKAGVETNFAGRRGYLSLDGDYFNKPNFDYYGPGPDSSKDDRTQYREENTGVSLGLRWKPNRHFTAGSRVGPLFVNVGPGDSNDFASTDIVFTPSQAPGLDTQTNFLVSGGFIDVQNLDFLPNPTAGTRGTVAFDHYADLRRRRFTFERLSAQIEHFMPFWNKKRVIALRAGTELSFKDPDQVIPFYLQPTLGGPRDLRGFRRYRFYDNNAMIFTAEYRWEVSTGFVMALFSDAGQVFSRKEQISWSNFQSDVGFGVRINARDQFALRVDTGFSHEGFKVWLQLTNVF